MFCGTGGHDYNGHLGVERGPVEVLRRWDRRLGEKSDMLEINKGLD